MALGQNVSENDLRDLMMRNILGENFGHRIVVCTTLREFEDPINNRIQRSFLERLLAQTHENWHLVVTTFGEKTVRPVVESLLGDKCSFVEESPEDLQGFHYSHSRAFLNGMAAVRGEDVLLWCTSDVLLHKDCFAELSKLYAPDLTGTIHPHLVSEDVKIDRHKVSVGANQSGFDLLFFAAPLLQPWVADFIKKYEILDWGGFDLILAALATKLSQNRVNLVNWYNVIKIRSFRGSDYEKLMFLRECAPRNQDVQNRAFEELGLDPACANYSVSWAHEQFRVLYHGKREGV